MVVEPDSPARDIHTSTLVVRLLRRLDVGEVDVREALGLTGLPVRGHPHALHVSVACERLPENVLARREAEVTDEECGARLALLVAERLRPAVADLILRHTSRLVNVDRPAIDLLTRELKSGFDGIGGGELDVAEPAGLASVAVHLNTGADNLTALFELGLESVVVDVPGETADEDGGDGFVV